MPSANCNPGWMTFTIIHSIVAAILSISALFALLKFIRIVGLSKTRRNSCIIFLITTVLILAWHPLQVGEDLGCIPIPLALAKYPFFLFFAMQIYLTVFIFWEQLQIVFAGTSMEITQRLKTIYKYLFIGLPVVMILLIAILIFKLIPYIAFLIIGILIVLLLLGMMVSLIVMFVYKLVIVYRHNDQHTADLLHAITKSTLLTSISATCTMVNIFQALLRAPLPHHIYIWIHAIIPFCDLYTSFLCVVMCFKEFHRYYKIFCSCFDRCCGRCCSYYVGKNEVAKNNVMMHQYVGDNTNTQGASDGTAHSSQDAVSASVNTATTPNSV